ncbi:MAG: hypothetical protein ABFC38_05690 [Methanospirillum sp.]
MRPQQRGGRVIAVCGLLLLLISGVAAAGAAVTPTPIVIANAADGQPFQPPADPAHVWVAGDVFSLHGVDQYRYIVVYTRDTADGRIHGCYAVDQEASGRYVVPEYVHGQEVFGDAFLAEQGAKFLANIPLNEVVITDRTPADSGKTYFGLTLGSIYGGANAPAPMTSPEPIPTAPHWPSVAPTQAAKANPATPTPIAAPTGVVSVTFTPGPTPTLPDNPQPIPMPTVTTTAVLPTNTEPTVAEPTGTPGIAPGAAPILEPTPESAVTSAPSRAWGKRFAAWQAPSVTGRRVAAGIEPAATVTTGSRATRTVSTFGRFYPPWSPFAQSTF